MTKKILGQPSPSTIRPPSTGPLIRPSGPSVVISPIARPRAPGRTAVVASAGTNEQQRPAGSLHQPRGDQPREAGSQPGRDAGQGEAAEREHQRRPTADGVEPATAGQRNASQRQQVGEHHPLGHTGGNLEVTLDHRQRDIDDTHVHRRHGYRQSGGGHEPPPVPLPLDLCLPAISRLGHRRGRPPSSYASVTFRPWAGSSSMSPREGKV